MSRTLRCALAFGVVLLSGCGAGAAPGDGGFVARSRVAQPAATSAVNVDVDARTLGPVVSADTYGASLDVWYNFNRSFVEPSLRTAGLGLIRFPGGSTSDIYHWENGGSLCDAPQADLVRGATLANLVRSVLQPGHFDLAVTLDYGSNRRCNAGGNPSEAGAWVAHAASLGVRGAHWTVGNEVYGSWEYDLHAKPHAPATYAAAVRTGYYPAVKAADPSAQLGVVVDLPNDRAWNDVVLRKAWPFDFVELHYYPESTPWTKDSDAFLLGTAIDRFARDLRELRVEMSADGVPASVPIYLGEYNADAGVPGKQSVSIVNGLFLGQMLGTLLDAGVPMATWWNAYGGCNWGPGADNSPTLYGWQHFGTFALFSDGLPNPNGGCPGAPRIVAGTPFPSARTMGLFAHAVPGGSHVLATQVTPGRGVRAYAFALARGYEIVLFNNTLAPIGLNVRIRGAGTTFVATESVYGKVQYDRSRQNEWVGPASRRIGTVSARIALTLAPYSMTALALR